jgi:hypothetical protein
MAKAMNVILGAGIAGLIFAFYNKNFTVITKDVGGQMASNFNLGPRYLHYTENAKSFLESLDYPIQRRLIRVGFISDDGWIDNPDEDFRKLYFMKSRNISHLVGYDSTVMNTNKKEFEVIDVDFQDLTKRLEEAISKKRFILGDITRIGIERKILDVSTACCGTKRLKYESLVSSIPLNIFYRHLEDDLIKPDLHSYHMTYALVNEEIDDLKDFDFVYDIRTTTKHHRMTKAKLGIVLDYFGVVNKEDLMRHFVSAYIDSRTLYNCQILPVEKILEFDNIKFIGRYGTWDRSWKTEKVIDEAMNESKRNN